VDAFSLGHPYRSGEPLSPVGGTINGKLLSNQTTVIVDITIKTTLVRAAEQYSVMAVDVPDMVAKFMESHEDIDTVRKMRYL
jgi:hypothetical protein